LIYLYNITKKALLNSKNSPNPFDARKKSCKKLKSNILLKFGDIFFNHKSSTSILRKQRWNNITNIRDWLYENVKDE